MQLLDLSDAYLNKAHQDFDSVRTNASSLLKSTDATLRVAIFMAGVDLVSTHLRFVRHFAYEVLSQTKTAKYLRVEQEKRTGEKVQGGVLIARHPEQGIYLLLSVDSAYFFEKITLAFLRKAYLTNVSSFYLNSLELSKILANLSAAARPDQPLRVRHLNTQSKLSGPRVRVTRESDLVWTDRSLEDIFNWVKDTGKWIKKIVVEAYPRTSPGLITCAISRDAVVSCTGSFELVYDAIIEPVCRMAASRLKFIKGRERRKDNLFKPQPVLLQFAKPVLADVEATKSLTQILRALPAASCSILHGNPYLKLSLVDYRDGSSYEIWVLSDSRITVVPQTRATVSSLERLCAHVFREFEEGDVKDFSEVYNE